MAPPRTRTSPASTTSVDAVIVTAPAAPALSAPLPPALASLPVTTTRLAVMSIAPPLWPLAPLVSTAPDTNTVPLGADSEIAWRIPSRAAERSEPSM